MIHRVLLLLIIAYFPPVVLADTWYPWRDRRVVSPNGEYYVVMKRIGGPKVHDAWGAVEYAIAKRVVNSPPVKAAESKYVSPDGSRVLYPKVDELGNELPFEIEPNPNVRVRKGDKTLGVGKLNRPPFAVLVSDEELGFAGLGVYGYNNYADYDKTGHLLAKNPNDAVIIFSSRGKMLYRKTVVDLFSVEELDTFDFSSGGLRWLNYHVPGWINEAKQQLVVVGCPSETKPNRYLIRFIDWKTGEVTKGPTLNSEDAVKKLRRKHLEANPKRNNPVTTSTQRERKEDRNE